MFVFSGITTLMLITDDKWKKNSKKVLKRSHKQNVLSSMMKNSVGMFICMLHYLNLSRSCKELGSCAVIYTDNCFLIWSDEERSSFVHCSLQLVDWYITFMEKPLFYIYIYDYYLIILFMRSYSSISNEIAEAWLKQHRSY